MVESVNKERRSEERTPVAASIYYLSTLEQYNDCKFWGVALNVSLSGVSTYSNISFKIGFALKVRSKTLWENTRDAKVKWCKKIDDDLYKLGFSLH